MLTTWDAGPICPHHAARSLPVIPTSQRRISPVRLGQELSQSLYPCGTYWAVLEQKLNLARPIPGAEASSHRYIRNDFYDIASSKALAIRLGLLLLLGLHLSRQKTYSAQALV